jgi:hypothetical protein
MQRSRRTNPSPFTWEIPLALVVGVSFLLFMGVQAGRSIANAAAGNGWVFVDRPLIFSSLSGIVAGHAGAGLTGLDHPAGAGLLWATIVVVEFVMLLACVIGLKAGLSRWGPTRLQGMATRSEAESLLGRTRLRKHAKVIRPDLYGASRGAGR